MFGSDPKEAPLTRKFKIFVRPDLLERPDSNGTERLPVHAEHGVAGFQPLDRDRTGRREDMRALLDAAAASPRVQLRSRQTEAEDKGRQYNESVERWSSWGARRVRGKVLEQCRDDTAEDGGSDHDTDRDDGRADDPAEILGHGAVAPRDLLVLVQVRVSLLRMRGMSIVAARISRMPDDAAHHRKNNRPSDVDIDLVHGTDLLEVELLIKTI